MKKTEKNNTSPKSLFQIFDIIKALFLLIITLLPFSSFGQSHISGKVIDSETNTPLYNANIYLKFGTYGTVANEEGKFVLDFSLISENDTIIISHLNFKEFKIKVQDFIKSNHVIFLERQVYLLDEISVYHTPSAKEILNDALKNIEKNHITHQYTLTGYFRQSAIIDEQIFRLYYSPIAIKLPKNLSKKTIVKALPESYAKEIPTKFHRVNLLRLEEIFQVINIERALNLFLNKLDTSENIVSVMENKMGDYEVYTITFDKNEDKTNTLTIEKNSKAVVSIYTESNYKGWTDTIPNIYKNGNRIESDYNYGIASINFSPMKDKWIPREMSAVVITDHRISDSTNVEDFTVKSRVQIIINDIHKKSIKGQKLNIGKDFIFQLISTGVPPKGILSKEEIEFIHQE